MDFSDLTQAAQDRIAAAELEAQGILNASQVEAGHLMEQAYDLGVDASGIGLSRGSPLIEQAREISDTGRGRAAGHRFGSIAIEYWILLKPDVERFRTKLETIRVSVAQASALVPADLDNCVGQFAARALRERAGMEQPAVADIARLSIGLPRPESWEDIELTFIGDHDLEIRIGDKVKKLNYKEIEGFEDRRNGMPSQLWAMVRAFGKVSDGTIPDAARHGKEWLATKKKIERASQALRKHFRMTSDPFPYISNLGYRSRVKIVLL